MLKCKARAVGLSRRCFEVLPSNWGDPEAEYLVLEKVLELRNLARDVLDERDREIFFAIHFEGCSRTEVGERVGLTSQRIGQIYRAALRSLESQPNCPFKSGRLATRRTPMTIEHDDLSRFQDAYLDYLEGARDEPPPLEDLPGEQRRAAEAFIKSITAARGVDPRASRPSIEQLLESWPQTPDPTSKLGEVLQDHLRRTVDPQKP